MHSPLVVLKFTDHNRIFPYNWVLNLTTDAHKLCWVKRRPDGLINSVMAFHYTQTVKSTFDHTVILKVTHTR